MSETIHYTQQEIKQLLLPILKKEGEIYQKSLKVYARLGRKGEKIATITGDGKETENVVVDASNYVVQNQTAAKEEYILTESAFKKRYEWLGDGPEAYEEYRAIGKIVAIKLTRKLWAALHFPNKQFYFEPQWGGRMKVKLYDYLVCPLDYSEIYRIARREFWETYKKVLT